MKVIYRPFSRLFLQIQILLEFLIIQKFDFENIGIEKNEKRTWKEKLKNHRLE